MWRDALLVAGKDLRIEARSRVALWQVLPFALLSLVLFAFALGPGTAAPARSAAPGLFWLAVLFSTVLATQRSFAIESGEGTRDGLRLSGIDPAGHLPRQGGGGGAAARRAPGGPVGRHHPVLRRPGPRAPGWPSWPRCWRPSAWRRPASSTARSRPACGCARRCCRCSSCRSSPRCCSPARGRGRRPSPASVSTGTVVAPDPRPVRRRLPGRRHRPLRPAAGGSMKTARCMQTGHRPGRRSGSPRRPPRVWLGLWVTPPDKVQGNLVRLLYLHPPVAWVALYLAFGLAALSSLLYLWRRTRSLVLGPPGRGRRSRSASSSTPSPSSPARSGAGRPGGSGGRGTPGSPAPRCCSSCSSATWPCAGCRPTPRCGPSAARWPRWSPSSTCRSSTSR